MQISALIANLQLSQGNPMPEEKSTPAQEDPAIRAKRLVELIRVRMKEQAAQREGSEALLHWLRADRSSSV